MTMRKLPARGAWIPYPINFNNGEISLIANLSLVEEAPTTKVAITFECPVSGELDTLEFYMDAGGADNATVLKVSFQDLDANGFPDGGIDQYRMITVGDLVSLWVQPGLITSDGTDVGTKRTVVRGQSLAFVIEFDSSNAGDVIYIGSIYTGDDRLLQSKNVCSYYLDGDWSHQPVVGAGALVYNASPQYYATSGLVPVSAMSVATLHTGTTPDEVGLDFSFQTNVRIGGASVCLSGATNNASWDCVVYDQTNTAIETVPMKLYTALFPANGYSYWTARFSSDIFVPGNEHFKITVKPSSGTSIKLLEISISDTVIQGDIYGYLDTGGSEHIWQHVQRTDGGTFSENAALLPLISINVTGSDMDAGGAIDDWTGDA